MVLTATGSRIAHYVTLEGQGLDGRLSLDLSGGWRPEHGWRGFLVDGGGEARGHAVELEGTVPLRYVDEQVELSAHCWRYREARLCLPEGARVGPEKAEAAWTLRDFDVGWLAPLAPVDLEGQGRLGGDGALRWVAGEGLEGSFQAQSQNGRLALTPRERPGEQEAEVRELAYDRLALQGHYRPSRAEVAFEMAAPKAGNASVQLGIDPRRQDQPLDGALELEGLRLRFFQPFVPQVTELGGRVDGSAEVGGTRTAPALDGSIELRQGRLAVAPSSSVVEDFRLRVDLAGSEADITGAFGVGEGEADIGGEASWSSDTYALDLELDGERLLADIPPYAELSVSPSLAAQLRPSGVHVAGRVGIPEGAIEVRELPQQTVSRSRDVVVVRRDENGEQALEAIPEAWAVDADVEIDVGDAVSLSALGLEGRLGGSLRFVQSGSRSEAFGEVTIEDGLYRAYGQRLTIRRGLLIFSGPVDRPQLDIEAVRVIERDGVTAGIRVYGFADRPQVDLFSEPAMSQGDALSYLVRGRPMGADGPGGDEMMATAALALGLHGGSGTIRRLAGTLGVQDFEIETAGQGDDAQVVLSGYITPRLYAAYGVSVFSSVNTITLRYFLTQQLYLEAVSAEDSALDLIYRFEID